MEKKRWFLWVVALGVGLLLGFKGGVAVAAVEISPQVREAVEKLQDPAVRDIAKEIVERVDKGDTREIRELEKVDKDVAKGDHPDVGARESVEQKAAPEVQKEVSVEAKAAPETHEVAAVVDNKAEATQQAAETKSDADALTSDLCALDPDNYHHDADTGDCVHN